MIAPSRASDLADQSTVEALNIEFRESLLKFFCRRVRDQTEAEDMVQEVFLRLMKRGDLAGLQQIGGYVFETASSVFIDRLRQSRTRHADSHHSFDVDRDGGVDFSPEHVLLSRERLARATSILLELPERTRTIFVLRRLEGMQYRDISHRLHISVSAVEKHMQRAIVHLSARMKDA